jgi:hypothetical protein
MPGQIDVLNQLLRTVEAIGIERTFDILKIAELGDIEFNNVHARFVITTVSNAFGIAVHEIVYGTGRKNERKYAIGFCAYYLHVHYDFNMQTDVSHFLNKDVTLCYKYCKPILKLNSNHVSDKKHCEIKEKLDKAFMGKTSF